jgi:hypothetical protein
MPIGAPRRRSGRRREPRRGIPPWMVVGAIVLALVAALYALGKTGGNDEPQQTTTAPRTDVTTTTKARPTTTTPSKAKHKKKKSKKASSSAHLARVQIVPTGPGPVFVCLQDAAGDLRIPGATLQENAATGTYRSRSFRLRLGNGNATIRVNGKGHKAADASPVGYVITRKGVRRVDVNTTPSCGR